MWLGVRDLEEERNERQEHRLVSGESCPPLPDSLGTRAAVTLKCFGFCKLSMEGLEIRLKCRHLKLSECVKTSHCLILLNRLMFALISTVFSLWECEF